jgi:hypothetical protein
MADDSDSVLKKTFGRSHIPRLAETRINQVAVAINRSIQVTPFSMNLDRRLIHIPGALPHKKILPR